MHLALQTVALLAGTTAARWALPKVGCLVQTMAEPMETSPAVCWAEHSAERWAVRSVVPKAAKMADWRGATKADSTVSRSVGRWAVSWENLRVHWMVMCWAASLVQRMVVRSVSLTAESKGP